MIYAGVDPGLEGAIALIHEDTMEIDVQPMPVITGTGRAQYNLVEIRNILELARSQGELFVTVERSQPMPTRMGGVISNYNRGVASGWLWMLTALYISHSVVSARVWQKAMLIGTTGSDTKVRSVVAASRLFPGVNLKRTERTKKPDSNFSDALLIAAFGMRQKA
jgi:hypothetical protein